MDETQLLEKIKTQIVDYTKLGFNEYGVNPPITQQSLTSYVQDFWENGAKKISGSIALGNNRVLLDGKNARITIYDADGNPIVFIGTE